MLKIYLIIVLFSFCSFLEAKEKNKKEKVTQYFECGAIGIKNVENVFGELNSKYFTKKISMKKLLRHFLIRQNKNLAYFLSKDEEKINESVYFEEALSHMRYDYTTTVECFFNSFQANNTIYPFMQKTSDGLVEGFVIVEEKKIKVILYTSFIVI